MAIQALAEVEIEIMHHQISIETIAADNIIANTQIYTLGSSSIYVINAIIGDSGECLLIESDKLSSLSPLQKTLNSIYKTMGVTILKNSTEGVSRRNAARRAANSRK